MDEGRLASDFDRLRDISHSHCHVDTHGRLNSYDDLIAYITTETGWLDFQPVGTGNKVHEPVSSVGAGADRTPFAGQVKAGVQTLGGIGSVQPYFDVTAFRGVTDVRFGNSGFNALRGPGAVNLDASLFRVFTIREKMNLQFRIEGLNATNTPHFSNPSTNVSNLQLNPDSTVRNLNGFGVITTSNRTGRQYDEREIRLGVRFAF